jgi:hypothetical protein
MTEKRRGVGTIEVLGIVAVFVATFLGVYLAEFLQERAREEQVMQNYAALLLVMEKDCQSAVELTNSTVGIATQSTAPAPGLMLASMFQYSLLLERMDPSRLTALVPDLAQAAQLSARHSRIAPGLDSLQEQIERGLPGAPKQIQDEVVLAAKERRAKLELLARETLQAYSAKLQAICAIVVDERLSIDSLHHGVKAAAR